MKYGVADITNLLWLPSLRRGAGTALKAIADKYQSIREIFPSRSFLVGSSADSGAYLCD